MTDCSPAALAARSEGTRARRVLIVALCALMAAIALALPARAALADSSDPAVGDTFASQGFVYEVVGDREAKLVAVDTSAAQDCVLSSTIRYVEGNKTSFYRLTSVAATALDGLGSLTVAAGGLTDQVVADALGDLSSATKLALRVEDQQSVVLKSSSSLSVDGSEASLPGGLAFSTYELVGRCSFENQTGAAVALSVDPEEFGEITPHNVTLAAGETFDTSWYNPHDAALGIEWSVDGGATWQSEAVVNDSSETIFIELPSGVAPDATVQVRFSGAPGIAQGLVTSNWDGDATTITLAGGTGKGDVEFTSPFDETWTAAYTLAVETSVADNAVWIGGVAHESDYASDDGSVAVSFAGGTPVVTLNGAQLDTAGGPGYAKPVIYCATDMQINLEGAPSTLIADGANTVPILCGGALTVFRDALSNADASLDIVMQNTSGNLIPSAIEGTSVALMGAPVQVTCRPSSSLTGALYGIHATAGDVELMSRGGSFSMAVGDKASDLAVYAASSTSGSVVISDVEVATAGSVTTALYAKNDVKVMGRSQVELAVEGNRWPAAIYAGGTFSADLRGTAFLHVEKARFAAGEEQKEHCQAALLAGTIELEQGGQGIAGTGVYVPENAQIGEATDPFGGTKQSFLADGAASSELYLASKDYLDSVVGKTFAELFPSPLVQGALWSTWLGKEGVIDPAYVLTGADAAQLSQVERLTLTSTPSFDGAGSGLENLPQLKSLTVTVNGAPETSFALPAEVAGNLSALKVKVGDQVESLSVDAPDFEGSLTVGASSEGSPLRDLTFGEDLYATSATVEGFSALTSLDVSPLADLELLSVSDMAVLENLTFGEAASLTELRVSRTALASIALPNRPYTSLMLFANRLTSLEIPEAAQTGSLTELDVAHNRLASLEVPASVTSLGIEGNRLADLVLTGRDFTYVDGLAPGDVVAQSDVVLTAKEQADGTVVLDLSAMQGRLLSVTSQTGTYDEASATIRYASAADAEADAVSYQVDTTATLTEDGESGDVVLDVTAQVAVDPYGEGPMNPDGDGTVPDDEGAAGPVDGGDSSEDDSAAEHQPDVLARTADGASAPLAAAAALALASIATACAAARRLRSSR